MSNFPSSQSSVGRVMAAIAFLFRTGNFSLFYCLSCWCCSIWRLLLYMLYIRDTFFMILWLFVFCFRRKFDSWVYQLLPWLRVTVFRSNVYVDGLSQFLSQRFTFIWTRELIRKQYGLQFANREMTYRRSSRRFCVQNLTWRF